MNYQELFTKNTFVLHLTGNIEDKQTFREFFREFQILQENASLLVKYEKAILVINSQGGDSDIASGIIDLIECSKIPIDAIVIGQCKSAAMRILQYCKKRYSTKRTRFMIHESGSYFKKTDYIAFKDLKSRYEDNEYRNKRLLNDIFHRSVIKDNLDKQVEIAKNTTYLNPDECLKLGLIDEIIG